MNENWKVISGYEGLYEVSDKGRVKSLKYGKERILNQQDTNCDYFRVALYKGGQARYMLVHRLVAEAFVSNPNKLDTVNHKDEDKHNNIASNLEWMSRTDNHNYGTHNQRVGEANINHPKKSKKVQMFDKQTGKLLATFPSAHEAERATGAANQSICKCCRGKLKSAGGYIWRYV